MSQLDTADLASGPHPPPSAPWLVVLVMFGATIAWAARFALGYLLTPASCEVGAWLQVVVGLVWVAVGAAALVANLVLLRRGPDQAVHFALLVGVGLNVFFLAAMVLESSAVAFVDPCAKGAIP